MLALVALGMSSVEIGLELTMAAETVKSHRKNIIAKLGARNSTHAVHLAHTHGILPPGRVWGGSHPPPCS